MTSAPQPTEKWRNVACLDHDKLQMKKLIPALLQTAADKVTSSDSGKPDG